MSTFPRQSFRHVCGAPRAYILFVLFWCGVAPTLADERALDFSRDIRPILSDHCFQCHGPDANERQADLRLDTNPEDPRSLVEEILRRVTSADSEEVMPPPSTQTELSTHEIEQLRAWQRAGGKWEPHWAFRQIQRPHPPKVATRVDSAIDAFVVARLEAHKLEPSPPASRSTLVRRLYLDVLGLVPPPHVVDDFVADASPIAYERLVDRLLANPRFGERWGRHWLDQARYADSDGYAIDGPRVMWPYRDWVIRALNADMPFDQFTIEQLAGDLLPDASVSQQVATGFHRNTLVNQEDGTDAEQFRVESVVDRTNTTAAVWLGLTLGCAQCHTHKYDPISHTDYYRFFAFFNSSQDRNSHEPRILVASRVKQAQREQLMVQREQARADRKAAQGDTERERAAKRREEHLATQIRSMEQRFGMAMVIRDTPEPRPTSVHIRGDFLRKGDRVEPNIPQIFGELSDSEHPRLKLARWLTSARNPLTARVTVNRIWMQYFGRGLVETENDFGLRGSAPSHPALLDWLASELIHHDWSLKSIHRVILLSSTYRQSSQPRADIDRFDANNTLLGRQVRLRVTAEVVRDLALSAADLLSDRIGGPSVFPPQPDGVYAFTQNRKRWKVSSGSDRYRRGLYTFFYRSAAHPFLTTFDTPNFQTTCTQRLRSNTPLQSLTMANDEAILDAARGLAIILQKEPREHAMELLFRRTLGRRATRQEDQHLQTFLDAQRMSFLADPRAAQRLTGGEQAVAELAAWTAVSRVLLNLDEFVTRN